MVVLNNALPFSSHFHHFENKTDTCRLFCRRKERSVYGLQQYGQLNNSSPLCFLFCSVL